MQLLYHSGGYRGLQWNLIGLTCYCVRNDLKSWCHLFFPTKAGLVFWLSWTPSQNFLICHCTMNTSYILHNPSVAIVVEAIYKNDRDCCQCSYRTFPICWQYLHDLWLYISIYVTIWRRFLTCKNNAFQWCHQFWS